MKTVGIIVEYNPLHYGHVYHFHESKRLSGADAVVAVMSGHFLQRGEPAVANKWARAEMALRMGVDVVIELPVAFSSQPAEWFAFGAVSALDSTGVVDCLCFGSESGEIGWLKHLARRLSNEPNSFRAAVKRYLKQGMNFPAAYSRAVQSHLNGSGSPPGSASVADKQLALPNNILGLHYLIALERLNSSIQPLTITRIKAGFHQTDVTDRQIASATAIRRLLFEQKSLSEAAPYIPDFTYELLFREWEAGRAPVGWNSFAMPLFHQLLSKSTDELGQISEVTEGLEYRLKQTLPLLQKEAALSVDGLLDRLKTKRYTRTKLQRTLLRILLNHSRERLNTDTLRRGVPYLRILGFSDKGRELLKRMKTTAKAPIVTKVTKIASPLLELDIQATSVYSLAYRSPSAADMFRDYYEKPVRYLP